MDKKTKKLMKQRIEDLRWDIKYYKDKLEKAEVELPLLEELLKRKED